MIALVRGRPAPPVSFGLLPVRQNDKANPSNVSRLREAGPFARETEIAGEPKMTRNKPPSLILASGSPRRRALLATLGLDFEIEVSGADEETFDSISPAEMVVELALRKARAVLCSRTDGIVLGADTTVVLDGLWLGKPADGDDAARLLRSLRGRTHQVLTGVALVDACSGFDVSMVVQSRVTMSRLSDSEISAYVAMGEPMDKAGAYGIQGFGRALVESVEGCFNNVVGLPLCAVAALLGRIGAELKLPVVACRLENGEPCPADREMERARRG